MKDEDIYAFNPIPPAPPPPPRPRRRVWPWLLAGAAALLLLALLASGLALVAWLGGGHEGLQIRIDGEDGLPDAAQGLATALALCGVGFGLLVALLVTLFSVGLVLPLTLLLVVAGLALGAGGAVLALGLVAAVLLSPLWGLLLLLWLLLRPRRAARMQA